MADDGVNAPAAGRWLGTGAALLVAVRVAAVLSTAGVTVAVARLLGPSLSGDYALMVALVVALTTLCGLGIDSGVVWLLSRREWGASSAFLTTQLAAAPLGAVGAGAGLGLYLITREDAFGGIDAAAAIVALASVPLSVGWLYAAQVALARGEYGRTAAIRAAFPALSLVLVPPLAAAF